MGQDVVDAGIELVDAKMIWISSQSWSTYLLQSVCLFLYLNTTQMTPTSAQHATPSGGNTSSRQDQLEE